MTKGMFSCYLVWDIADVHLYKLLVEIIKDS